MTPLLIIYTLFASQIDQSAAFTSAFGGHTSLRSTTCCVIKFPTPFAAASSDNNEADSNTEETASTPSSLPPAPKPLEFTTAEIEKMENLILDLSKEQNDDLRRQKLADILDKELEAAAAVSNASNNTETEGEVISSQELPRFAQIFQYTLDIVGEKVQTAAREKAIELNENSLHVIEDSSGENVPGTGSDRIKSDEEMQLWALIDMMVQSKTRVKLYMGSLGSKGAFR